MKLLNKLTINNLKLNKKRTIVTIVGIMLSVALITAVATIFSSGLQSIINYEIQEYGRYHIAFTDMPPDEAKALESNRAVDAVSITTDIGYAVIDSRNQYKPYVYIEGFSADALKNLSVRLIDGRFPENENEILIPDHLKTNGKASFAIGDTITLDVGKRMAADGLELNQRDPYMPAREDDTQGTDAESITDTKTRTYTITGIIERPIGTIEPYSAPGYTLITAVDETTLQGNAKVYVHFTKSKVKDAYKIVADFLGVDADLLTKSIAGEELTKAETARLALQALTIPYQLSFNETLIILESNPANISSVSTLAYAVYIVIAIIVLTSIFCIKNSFDISISEKIRQYGMLRSIGATKAQIRKNVFFEAAVLGAFGIPLGFLLGFGASYILVRICNFLVLDLFEDRFALSFVFSWRSLAVAVLLGIVTVCFSAFRSAVRASRVTPLDSIRNSAQIKINPKKLRAPKIIRKIFGIGGEISYKNLKRNKKKYRTTVISIAVSATVFIALSSFMTMAFDETDRELQRSEYNILVTVSYTDMEEYQRIVETAHFDHVQNASITRETNLKYTGTHYSKDYAAWAGLEQDEEGSGYITILTLDDEQYAKYCRSQGLDPEALKEKAILFDYEVLAGSNESGNAAKQYMRLTDFEKGDVIEGFTETDRFMENDTTDHRDPVKIEIAAISEEKPFGYKNWGGTYLIISNALFDSIAQPNWVRAYYSSDDSDKLQEELDEFFKNIDYHLSNNDADYKRTNNLFTLIGIFLYGFIIVISLIGITNIFNTITTNMELRKPEFAMLRSVGMTNQEFHRMIRLESLFMGIRSLLFGIPVGVLLSYLIYRFLAAESGSPFRVPLTAILITVAAVFILIFLIMTYSMGKIRKQNTIETIRNENI